VDSEHAECGGVFNNTTKYRQEHGAREKQKGREEGVCPSPLVFGIRGGAV